MPLIIAMLYVTSSLHALLQPPLFAFSRQISLSIFADSPLCINISTASLGGCWRATSQERDEMMLERCHIVLFPADYQKR